LRSKSGASNGSRSSGEGANEMPQKSVEPTPRYRPMMSRSVWVASSEASRTRFATGRYRGHVAGELLDRLVLRLAAPFETRPVRRDGDPSLAPRGLFDKHAKTGRHRLIVPAAMSAR